MIRQIKKEEIPECVNVIKDSFLTVASEFGITQENAPRYVAFATTDERLLWQFNEGRSMFAYFNNDKKIIGYYSLEKQGNSECELNNLCVLNDFRHKGIGKELLHHAFIHAKDSGCKQMNIGITEENVKLKNWYASFGFIHIGIKKFDFFPFTSGYMKKEL
ncbi:MAG: GNAT family N-acetyltransferase [Eubacteriales bacterium]|nr:GNAT family N-acetyltransferase [Eubacteriales bacterium]MDD4475069.1 GNAT family N-acetyltransferase [Eubacteriales bacterium]